MNAIGRYALVSKAVMQGTRMDDIGQFGVTVAFPRQELVKDSVFED